MRTNIDIDDKLIAEAMQLSGLTTKKQVVDEALKQFIRHKKRLSVLDMFGKVQWEGDLEAMRLDK
jgi:Arc/MetJ family transcription regulator